MVGDTPRGAFTMSPPSAPKVAFSATASTEDSGALVGKGGAKPIATLHSDKHKLLIGSKTKKQGSWRKTNTQSYHNFIRYILDATHNFRRSHNFNGNYRIIVFFGLP